MAAIGNNDIANAIYFFLKENSGASSVEKVVSFLAKRKLLSKHGGILEALYKVIDREEDRVVANIESAKKLNHQTTEEIENFLRKRYSVKNVAIKENINSDLLLGFRVTARDEIIDFSMQNKIAKLKEYLTR